MSICGGGDSDEQDVSGPIYGRRTGSFFKNHKTEVKNRFSFKAKNKCLEIDESQHRFGFGDDELSPGNIKCEMIRHAYQTNKILCKAADLFKRHRYCLWRESQ